MTAESSSFKFSRKVAASGFSNILRERVDDYFRGRRITRFANSEMVAKTVLGFALWIITYAWLISDRASALEVIGIYVLHGYAQLFMGLNIAHDANHSAYSKSRRINRALGWVFDLVGLSSYMWRLMHNHSHHFFVNVRGADSALASGGMFRFTPHDVRKPIHRFQHLYAPLFYCLVTLDWVLAKDYRWLLHGRFGNRRITRHPRKALVLLFLGKAFYYTYTLVLPLVFLSVPWYAVVLGFVVMHLFLGFTLALTFQPNHFTEASGFPEPDREGGIAGDYIEHVFGNTADYCRGNPLAKFALGGLNLHVVHHMFPGVCHVHYPALTRILKTTAEEHGLPYREHKTLTSAFLAHLSWLKALGRADPTPAR